MRVDHRRRYILLAKQLLNRPDVVAVLQKMSGERVSECVAARQQRSPGIFLRLLGLPRHALDQNHARVRGASAQRPVAFEDQALGASRPKLIERFACDRAALDGCLWGRDAVRDSASLM